PRARRLALDDVPAPRPRSPPAVRRGLPRVHDRRPRGGPPPPPARRAVRGGGLRGARGLGEGLRGPPERAAPVAHARPRARLRARPGSGPERAPPPLGGPARRLPAPRRRPAPTLEAGEP